MPIPMNTDIQEAQNLLDQLQGERSRLKRLLKCDNTHPMLEEHQRIIYELRFLLDNWDEKRWQRIRWGINITGQNINNFKKNDNF